MDFFNSRLYRAGYDIIRKNPVLNHLAHKAMQSEWIYHVPGYTPLYKKMIEAKAAQAMFIPPFLEITLTDICNSNCVMCPPAVKSGSTIMADQLFEKIVIEAETIGIRKMILTGGEPLLDRHVHSKIAFAKRHGFEYVHMFTNGSLMNGQRAAEILAAGLDSLTISVDSAIKKEYEAIRVGLSFDVVLKNIKELMTIKKREEKSNPIVRVNMVALPQNASSRTAFIELFGNIVDIAEIMDNHNWGGSENSYGGGEYKQIKRFPCHLLFQKVCISPEGFIRRCSIDNSQNYIADLNISTLNIALTSSDMAEIKKKMLTYDFNMDGCRNCTHKESWWVDYKA